NALKLGGSLVLTLGIGFGIRIALRRHLGPAVMGPINFADAFTATAFVFIGLGLDTYVRKIVPVAVDGANEFLGTVFAARALLSVAVFATMGVVLHLMGQPPEVQLLVWVYGAAQLCTVFNMTFVALLQSARTIDGLSTVNVVSKLIWAAGFAATIIFGLPIVGIPLSVLTAEFLKLIVGYFLCRKHVKLSLRIDWSKLRPVLRSAFPFYVNGVALVIVNRFDVNVLKVRADDTEIGLYSAASELAQMTFVLTPMIGGVVMPLFARAQARGVDEYHRMVRRTLELILMLAFPASLAIAVGADFWVHVLLGEQYAASSLALSILGPSFLLTYAAVVIAVALNLSGGEWTVTVTSLSSVIVNPLLVMVLVTFGKNWGPGGAGAACALAAVGTEAFVLTVMFARIGKIAMDRRLALMITKSTVACLIVLGVDRFLLQSLGAVRLLIDGALYAALVVVSGAVSIKESLAFARQIRAQRAAS
ncbi:MAG: flippase, partial [Archangium sp.]|nr:flippase [Archangium sp.]